MNSLKQQDKILLKKISLEKFFKDCSDTLLMSVANPEIPLSNIYLKNKYIGRPGLALSGYFELYQPFRVLVFGNSEWSYLSTLDDNRLKKCLTKLIEFKMPCFVFSNNNNVRKEQMEIISGFSIPIFISQLNTDQLLHKITAYLWRELSEKMIAHGCLVDVFGIGTLIVGEPGIGKSESALELIKSGHRVIADDIVIIEKQINDDLVGKPEMKLQDFIEIRGVGIINLKELYGTKAILNRKKIDLIVSLEMAARDSYFERLGMEIKRNTILNTELPYYTIPIRPGKNIASIIETIALNYISRLNGYNAPEVLNQRLLERNLGNEKNDGGQSEAAECYN